MRTIGSRSAAVLSLLFLVALPARFAALHAQNASGSVQAADPGQPSHAYGEPEQTTVRDLRIHWRTLFDDGDWSQLDAIAEQLRNGRLRFPGGAWQLRVFYATISSAGPLTATDADWQAQFTRLQSWIQQNPSSPTPRIALSDAYLHWAWKARGNGFAPTVTQDGWKLFCQRIQMAQSTLDDAQKIGAVDPEWYRAMQTVALAQGWDRSKVENLLNEAINAAPDYFYLARSEANYLLPKWYGKPGETEQFAEQVADQIGGDEGDAVYFLIDESINCCRRLQAPAMSWPRVRQGFFALDRLYGTTNGQRNAMAFLALRAGDTQTAQQLFARIGNDWARGVWRSKVRFDASRTGQPIAGIQPVGPVRPPASPATE
jgi:hypothetical protein